MKNYSFSVVNFFLLMYIQKVQSEVMLQLSSGHTIPVIGLGTHGLNGEKLEFVLTAALDIGIKLFDTGFNYDNEEAIGKTLKKWFTKGGKREDIFITTKLPYFGNQASEIEKYLKLSLERLGLDYIDLYLIHAPFGVKPKPASYEIAKNTDGTVVLDLETNPINIWKEMEKQVKAGRIKSIGLSNFNETQIRNIMKEAKIKPSNLQIEVHAYHQQKILREFCQKNDIIVTAYAPLSSTNARTFFRPDVAEEEFLNLYTHPVVSEIAKKHGKSNAQILLRHIYQGGAIVLPSSKNPVHLKENLQIFNFKLNEDEIKKLDSLDKGDRGKIFDYKLILKGIEKHPFYPW